MSVKKEFVIKHVFTDLRKTALNAECYGKKENHFNVPWRIKVRNIACPFSDDIWDIYLECMEYRGTDEWSIEATANFKIQNKIGEVPITKNLHFSQKNETAQMIASFHLPISIEYLESGNWTVEIHVEITKMSGIKRKPCHFDDESAKEFSDVVLKVDDRKFYVLKKYLSYHSSYFKSLFMGNFSESDKSEIELKGITSYDFENYLELLYGISEIKGPNIAGILKLADMYDSKTTMRKCEEFLVKSSNYTLKEKSEMAIKYKMDKLKDKCLSKMKMSTIADIRPIVPEDAYEFHHSDWEEQLDDYFS